MGLEQALPLEVRFPRDLAVPLISSLLSSVAFLYPLRRLSSPPSLQVRFFGFRSIISVKPPAATLAVAPFSEIGLFPLPL